MPSLGSKNVLDSKILPESAARAANSPESHDQISGGSGEWMIPRELLDSGEEEYTEDLPASGGLGANLPPSSGESWDIPAAMLDCKYCGNIYYREITFLR